MKEENKQEVANNDTQTKPTEAVEDKDNPKVETADGKVIEANKDGSYTVQEPPMDKPKEGIQLPNGEIAELNSPESKVEIDENVEKFTTESPNLNNEIIERDNTRDWIYAPYEFISGGKHNGLSVSTYGFQIDKGAIIMTVVERDGNISNDIEFIPEARIIKHEDGTKSIK